MYTYLYVCIYIYMYAYIFICMHSRGSGARVQRGLQKRGISQKTVLLLLLLMWGWVFFERTRILSGIQFTTHFIEFFVVETKRFVGTFANVILTRQPFGQRSSRAAESKRRALGNYFPERICYVFLISKCRGD